MFHFLISASRTVAQHSQHSQFQFTKDYRFRSLSPDLFNQFVVSGESTEFHSIVMINGGGRKAPARDQRNLHKEFSFLSAVGIIATVAGMTKFILLNYLVTNHLDQEYLIFANVVCHPTAGTGNYTGYPGDGSQANAKLHSPYGVAVDTSVNIYVADSSNHVIRVVQPNGIVSTFAGNRRIHN